jgi:hypothetical protein
MEELFGKAPLFAGESESDFTNLLARIAVDLQPTDIIEWIWIYDITVLVGETLRWRRLRASMLREAQQKELQKAIHNALAMRHSGAKFDQLQETASDLARSWAAGYAVHETIADCFSQSPSDANSVTAKVFLNHLEQIERIERMIASVTARHGAILREIDRRRESFARRVREVTREITEVELVEEPGPQRGAGGIRG